MRFRFGEFVLDTAQRQLEHGSSAVHLSPKAYQLLELLIAKAPAAVSKEELLDRLWPDVAVEEGNVKNLVAELRSALGESGGDATYIRTAHRFGYAFAADVSEVASRTGKRRTGWMYTAAVLLSLAGAVLSVTVRLSRDRPIATPVSVAVIPFEVDGPNLAYAGDAIADLMSSRFDGVGGLTIVDSRAIRTFERRQELTRTDVESGRRVATQFKAATFVMGTLVGARGHLRATASLYNADGRMLGTAMASVPSEADLFTLVDRLAAQLIVFTSASRDRRLTSVAAQTTTSYDAFREYVEGDRELIGERYGAAEEHFEKAVRQDGTYALAWYRLSVAQGFGARPRLAFQSLERAQSLSGRLSGHDRRLLEGWGAFLRGDTGTAEQALRSVTDSHTDDLEAWWLLAETRFHRNYFIGRARQDAEGPLRKVLELDPKHVVALAHLMNLTYARGNLDETRQLAERYRAASPPNAVMPQAFLRLLDRNPETILDLQMPQSFPEASMLVRWIMRRRDFALMDRMLDRCIREEKPGWTMFGASPRNLKGAAEMFRGRERSLKAIVAGGPDPFVATLTRGFLTTFDFIPFSDDELRDVREEMVRLTPPIRYVELAPTERVRDMRASAMATLPYARAYVLGSIGARLHDRTLLANQISVIENLPKPPMEAGSFRSDVLQMLRAREARLAGDHLRAVREIERVPMARVWGIGFPAVPFSPAVFLLHGDLLESVGRHDEAFAWFDAYASELNVEMWIGAVGYAKFRAARSLDRMGRKSEAAERYRDFVAIWIACDPELRPALVEAQKRLAVLHVEEGKQGLKR